MMNTKMAKRMAVIAMALPTVKVMAIGLGTMASTVAIRGFAGEASGPLAYGLSLIMVVLGAISWFRHHHDMGAIGNGVAGTLVIGGVALGGASLLGFIPGVAGAVV